MTGQPRRIELRAQSEVWVMHVPLETMEQMATSDPNAIRAFGVISILSSDKLLRIVHDLQKKDVSCRIASALHRMSWATDTPIPISQENLSVMTSTSRKQVNSAIQRLWRRAGLRSATAP